MSILREVHTDGWRVRLDIAAQVLHLEVPEFAHSRADDDLSPTFPPDAGPVSAATLLVKAKHFDDSLYAGVELAAQQGAGHFVGKGPLLRALAEASTGTDAAVTVCAACELGNLDVAVPAAIRGAVDVVKQAFAGNELLSKPLGFYTWTERLRAIFRQDRFLQQALEPKVADALDLALARSPNLAAARNACLQLNARLTNPRQPPSIDDAGKRAPFFPPSRSHEVTLFENLYETARIPDGFNLMDELISRVRSGQINLMPREDSGWYDHQTWSLEPLLNPERRPESRRLVFGKRYRKHLEDLFRGALALMRETHVKAAGGGRGGYGGVTERPLWIAPELHVEPLPSVYARRADSYRFIRSVLESAFGVDGFGKMHRLVSEGREAFSLAEGLTQMERLFDGAAAVAAADIGLDASAAHPEVEKVFQDWRRHAATDPELSRDVRTMVPVFYDVERRKIKVWTFLGWRTTPVTVQYRDVPFVLGIDRDGEEAGHEKPRVLFTSSSVDFPVPVTAEVYVSRLLNRGEFRRHGDRFHTREAILANLH